MNDLIATVEMAEIWGITRRRFTVLCDERRIEGVIKRATYGLFIPRDS